MRLKAQIHNFRLNQNSLESHKHGGIVEHSIYRPVSKGGVMLLPGQAPLTSVYLSAIPHSNYGGNNLVDVIGKDILPSALTKLADNVDSKTARTILNIAAKLSPYAASLLSSFLDKGDKGKTKSNIQDEHDNNYTYERPITYNQRQPITYKQKQAIEHHPSTMKAVEHKPNTLPAIEHHPSSNLPAIEYKGSGNTRAKKAYEKFLKGKKKEQKKSTKHKKGGAILCD